MWDDFDENDYLDEGTKIFIPDHESVESVTDDPKGRGAAAEAPALRRPSGAGSGGQTSASGTGTVYCMSCGKKNSAGAKFCISCGAPLVRVESAARAGSGAEALKTAPELRTNADTGKAGTPETRADADTEKVRSTPETRAYDDAGKVRIAPELRTNADTKSAQSASPRRQRADSAAGRAVSESGTQDSQPGSYYRKARPSYSWENEAQSRAGTGQRPDGRASYRGSASGAGAYGSADRTPYRGSGTGAYGSADRNAYRSSGTYGPAGGDSYRGAPYSGRSMAGRGQYFGDETGGAGIIRRISSENIFTAAVITFTAAIVMHFISALAGAGAVNSLLRSLDPYGFGYGSSALSTLTGLITGSSFGTVFLSELMNILTAVGLWLIYAERTRAAYREYPTTGLTLIQVAQIINLVGLCIGALVVIILVAGAAAAARSLSNSLFGGYGYGSYSSGVTGAVVFFIVLLIAVVVLAVLFYVKVLRMVADAKQTALGVSGANIHGSKYVGVIAMIAGIASVIMAFISIGSFSALLYNLLRAVASITFSLIVFRLDAA